MNNKFLAIAKCLKNYSIELGITAAFLLTNQAVAATLFWNLELLDSNGDRVGTGKFSYNPETVDVFSVIDTESGDLSSFSQTNVLESFEINIFDRLVEFEPSNKWWQTNSETAMQQVKETILGDAIDNSWTLISNSVIPPLFALAGSSDETTAQGTWFFGTSDVIVPDPSLADLIGINAFGTWNASLENSLQNPPNSATVNDNNATSIPESSTVFGLLALAVIGLVILSKKQLKLLLQKK